MGEKGTPSGSSGSSGYRSSRTGWQRVSVDVDVPHEARDTIREGAPSPSQEVIAKADEELLEQSEPEETPDQETQAETVESTTICF